MSLQFDEFQALRRRQQAAKQTREEDASEDASEVVSESSYASASVRQSDTDPGRTRAPRGRPIQPLAPEGATLSTLQDSPAERASLPLGTLARGANRPERRRSRS